jgi:hypothetical protein
MCFSEWTLLYGVSFHVLQALVSKFCETKEERIMVAVWSKG